MGSSASSRSTDSSTSCSSSPTIVSACTTRSPTRWSSRPDRPAEVASDVDAVVSAETPEGILLELRPAGLTARFLAFALDWLIRLVVIYGAAILGQFLAGFGIAFYIVLLFALDWF